jgi:type IV secretory pathway protease TraF
VIAFKTPPAAAAYLDTRKGHMRILLKVVAAARGDFVCIKAHRLYIDGISLGDVASHDGSGAPLPQWRDCRILEPDEVFVLGQSAAHSFDSRYFGPISKASIIGSYVLSSSRRTTP